MKYSSVLKNIVIIGLLCSLSSSCNLDNKIPITTNSQEALKYYKIGLSYSDKLLIYKARNYFETAIVFDSSFALCYMGLAFVSPDANGFLKNFSKAKSLLNNVSEGEKLWILGAEAGNNGYQLEQNELYKKLVELYPNDERAHGLLGGNYFFGLQDYKKSISSYKKAINIDPQFSPAYNIIGYAYRTLEKYDEAEKAFKKYINLIPHDANPYDSYAELLLKTGKFEESIKYYKKAISVDPTFQLSYRGIAANLILLGSHKEARDKLQIFKQKALNTGNERTAYYSTALSFIDEGNPELALNEIIEMKRIAESIDDTSTIARDYNLMGLIQSEFGKYDEALGNFTLAWQLVLGSELNQQVKDNFETNFAYNKTIIALAKGQIDSANYYSKKYEKLAFKRDNSFQKMRNNRLKGMIAYKQRDFNNSIVHFEKTNLQNPYNLYRIALAYEGKNETEKAKDFYEKAANFNALNDLNFWLVRQKALKKISEM